MMMKIPAIERIDFYDHEKLDKLHESRARKWLKLFLKAKRGDPKATEAIKKHEAEDRELKRRSNESGYYWT
jgi:hypothetical protein